MRRAVQWFTAVLAASGVTLGAAACGDDGASPTPPPALEITARTPAPNATAVETGATVTVTFNQGIDPATLTAATFIVRASGVALPVARTYDAAMRTATATAPFLPGRSYEVEVTTGVRTLADSALGAAAVWSFATRAWQAVIVEATGFVGQWTSVAMDGSGQLNVTYQGGTNGSLNYATCAAACATAVNWLAATVDAGAVQHTSLAVDGSGRRHVSYYDVTSANLRYATCATTCATASNWQAVTVAAAGVVGQYPSLAVDGSGRVHVSYYDSTNADLKYATCAAACATSANWQTVTVDTAEFVGTWTSLAADASRRLHVSYFDDLNDAVKYATCDAACATAANWQVVTVDASGSVGYYTSLTVEGNGRLHLSYFDNINVDLKYATCAAACTTTPNWHAVTVDATGSVGAYTSQKVDGSGRVHVSYYDLTSADLKYATCAAACATAANWRTLTVDATGTVGWFTSLAVDAGGRVHVSYHDFTNTALKYIE